METAMPRRKSLLGFLAITGACVVLHQFGMRTAPSLGAPAETAGADADLPASASEARARARLLHETIHGTLQVVHRDFFHAEESRDIPSKSLEEVFQELERGYHVKLRWLAVNAMPMNVEHQAKNQFETDAVKALESGKREFEAIDADSYQYAGTIRLSAICLKCHLPLRKSNDDRTAALVIKMPWKQQP